MDFSTVFTFSTVMYSMLGTLFGILFGFLPGLSCTMAVAVILPFTFKMESVAAFALLLGTYCGGMFGGAITAILIKTPGTPQNAATVLDGYPMAQKGQAKRALTAATITSFIGGIFSCAILYFLAKPLANVALEFGPPEYFAVGLFGLSIVSSLSGKNILKGVIGACFGLMLSTIGSDPVTGIMRFTFGSTKLMAGLQIVAVLIGLFAIAEVFTKLEASRRPKAEDKVGDISGKGVSAKDLLKNWFNMLRSAVIGVIIGIIPGTGGGTAAWVSYNAALRSSKNPEKFGTGCLEGVVASETANNAVTGGALVPLLSLGIPGDTVTAVLLGALMIQGLTPGPTLFAEHPDVVNGIYVMLILANIFMLIFGLLGVRGLVKVLKIPTNILFTCVLLLCCVGAFAMRNNVFDIQTAVIMGVLGFLLVKAGFTVPPILLGMILGNMIESNLRRSLIMSGGSASILFNRPISLILIIVSVIMFVWPIAREMVRKAKAKKAAAAPKADAE